MAKNFFNLTNPDFFSILTGKYKEINYELLTRINQVMEEENGQLERNRIIEIIMEYFDSMPNLDTVDYDLDGRSFIDFKKHPSELLRNYETKGWLSSEPTSDFKTVYQMEPCAITILSAMKNAVDNEDRPIESSGYVYTIYNTLKTFDVTKGTGLVEQLNQASQDLKNNLNSVNNKIRKYLNDLLKDELQSPKKILGELLINYQNNIVARSFNNLRNKDNPSIYKNEIIKDIDNLKSNSMDELIENYIDVKYNGIRNEDNELEAKVFFTEVFNSIRDQFNSINDKIERLNAKNAQYVSSAKSRVLFLLNDKDNLEGKVDRILRLMETKYMRPKEEFEFSLYDKDLIDENSLYSYQRNANPEPTVLEVEENYVTEEELEARRRNIMRLKQFTIVSVDRFLMNALENKESIEAKDIPIETFDQFMMLFLSRIYSQEKIIHYQCESLGTYFEYQNRKIENFKITRRVK